MAASFDAAEVKASPRWCLVLTRDGARLWFVIEGTASAIHVTISDLCTNPSTARVQEGQRAVIWSAADDHTANKPS